MVDTVKDGIVYGHDGKRMDADDGNSNQIKFDIDYPLKDYKTKKIMVPEGSDIVVTSAGKLRTNTTVKIEGDNFTITQGSEKDEDGHCVEEWRVDPKD